MFQTRHIAFSAAGALMFAGLVLAAFAALPGQVRGQVPSADPDDDWPKAEPVKPADAYDAPRQHFRLANPAKLTDARAEALYARLKLDMSRSYRFGNVRGSGDYQTWRRYNTAPYPSVSHGRRLVNNYANDTARAYGKFEGAGILPVGSILAKDSISVTAEGNVSPGPLALMEKMPAGFNPASGDWRYALILPDGAVFGVTNGAGSKRVKFCISCHLAAEDHDHLYFLPKRLRRSQ